MKALGGAYLVAVGRPSGGNWGFALAYNCVRHRPRRSLGSWPARAKPKPRPRCGPITGGTRRSVAISPGTTSAAKRATVSGSAGAASNSIARRSRGRSFGNRRNTPITFTEGNKPWRIETSERADLSKAARHRPPAVAGAAPRPPLRTVDAEPAPRRPSFIVDADELAPRPPRPRRGIAGVAPARPRRAARIVAVARACSSTSRAAVVAARAPPHLGTSGAAGAPRALPSSGWASGAS